MMNIKTIVMFNIFALLLILTSRLNITYGERYTCGVDAECMPNSYAGEYCCQDDQMICTGSGCPSWACLKSGCFLASRAAYPGYQCLQKTCPCMVETCDSYSNGDCIEWDWRCCLVWNGVCQDGCWICVDYEQVCDSWVCDVYYTTTPPCTNTYCSEASWVTGGTCSWCPEIPEEPPVTCTSVPSAPIALISPANGSTLDNVNNIPFTWSGPADWGGCTGTPTYTFRYQLDDDAAFGSMQVNTNTLASTLLVSGSTYRQTVDVSNVANFPYNTNYKWRVSACNDIGCGPSTSAWNFNLTCGRAPSQTTLTYPANNATNIPISTVSLQWNAPADWGVTCKSPNNRTYTVKSAIKIGATCPVPGASYATVPGCSSQPSADTDCTLNVIRDTSYCWYVEANNGSVSPQYITPSPVYEFKTEDPLLYQNWVTTLLGDFYSGGITIQFPSQDSYVAPWNPPHVSYERDPAAADTVNVSTVSSGDITIYTDNTNASYKPASQSGLWVDNANYKKVWPSSYNREYAPTEAIELPLPGSTCATIFTADPKLDPFKVYKGGADCIETAIGAVASAPDGYELATDGYAVVFVEPEGDNEVEIDSAFTTTNDNYRVIFAAVQGVNVFINRSLSLAADPTFASNPLIEAAFIVNGTLEFDGVQGDATPDPINNPDSSILVEGPIVAKSAVFNRNRGPTNQYPSELIKYNPNYIYNLTEQERASLKSNGSGLFVLDVDWVSEE